MFGRPRIEYKTNDQISKMRVAGLVVADALAAVKAAGVAGVSTAHLNEVARTVIVEAGAIPSFFGYGSPPFPGVICTSINDEVVHGVPGERTLQPGDLVSIDCGAIVDGWHGDSALSFVVPGEGDAQVIERRQELSAVTKASLWDGIAAVAVGKTLNDVGGAIEDAIDSASGGAYGIVEGYSGHGIGTSLHMAPDVYNYRVQQRTPKIKPGLCIAIEPMITTGSEDTKTQSDNWTVATTDGSDAAHWEHTVAVTDTGIWVLTAHDGGKAELAQRNVTVSPLAD